jgi:hypothetical protein
LIDLADAVTLENLAEVLAHSHNPADLHASVQLERFWTLPPPQVYIACLRTLVAASALH